MYALRDFLFLNVVVVTKYVRWVKKNRIEREGLGEALEKAKSSGLAGSLTRRRLQEILLASYITFQSIRARHRNDLNLRRRFLCQRGGEEFGERRGERC